MVEGGSEPKLGGGVDLRRKRGKQEVLEWSFVQSTGNQLFVKKNKK